MFNTNKIARLAFTLFVTLFVTASVFAQVGGSKPKTEEYQNVGGFYTSYYDREASGDKLKSYACTWNLKSKGKAIPSVSRAIDHYVQFESHMDGSNLNSALSVARGDNADVIAKSEVTHGHSMAMQIRVAGTETDDAITVKWLPNRTGAVEQTISNMSVQINQNGETVVKELYRGGYGEDVEHKAIVTAIGHNLPLPEKFSAPMVKTMTVFQENSRESYKLVFELAKGWQGEEGSWVVNIRHKSGVSTQYFFGPVVEGPHSY